jgi:hypothetical protein
VILFVVLPFAVAALVVPFVAWRSSGQPRPTLTSEILADGIPGEAQILAVKTLGSIVDIRPMVRFELRIIVPPDEEPFDLEVIQSMPRSMISSFRSGQVVEIRLTPDRSAGAVGWGRPPPPQ